MALLFAYPGQGTVSDASRGGGAGVSVFLDEAGLVAFSDPEAEISMDLSENVAACRVSLSACAALLAFADILLCMLLGGLCASIFSYFWKLNR